MTVTNLLFEPSGCNLPFRNDVIVWPALEMIPRVASEEEPRPLQIIVFHDFTCLQILRLTMHVHKEAFTTFVLNHSLSVCNFVTGSSVFWQI